MGVLKFASQTLYKLNLHSMSAALICFFMLTEFKSLEAQALALPPEDRERLASHLFRSLNSTKLSTTDLEWIELAEKRYQALKTGEDPGMSEDEFFAALN